MQRETILIKRVSDLTETELQGTGATDKYRIKQGLVRYVAIGGKFGGVVDWFGGDLSDYITRLVYFQTSFELHENLKQF